MIAPCRDCPERGCGAKHDTCEAYQEYVKQREIMREAHRKEVDATKNHYDRIRRMIRSKEGKRI